MRDDGFVPELEPEIRSWQDWFWVGLCMTPLAVAIVGGSCNYIGREEAGPAMSASAPAPEGWEYVYRARVVRVVDADTVDLAVSLGFGIEVLSRVRLAGVDAPEMKTADGRAARDRVAALLPVDSETCLKTDGDRRDKFGRLLGRLELPDGLVLNDWLLENGLAKPYGGG